MRALAPALALVVACSFGSLAPASAQPADPQIPEIRERRAVELPAALGEGVAQVRTVWSPEAERNIGQVRIGRAAAVELHRGSPVAAAIVSGAAEGHPSVLVAWAESAPRGASRFWVRLYTADGWQPAVRVQRPGASGDPYAVVGTATPGGYDVFFQELNGSGATTYRARITAAGTATGAAEPLAIPWGLAAVAWNGNGYHLALIFPGGGSAPRLSMVTLSPAGAPQQHPDWASAAGMVSEVHLAQRGTRVIAFFRGGAGDRMIERDVTRVGPWGREPGAPISSTRIRLSQAIVVHRAGDQVTARRLALR